MPEADAAVAEPLAADPGAGPEELAAPPTVEAPAAKSPPAGKDKKSKDKKGKDKKGKDKGAAEELPDGPSIAGHPRAARSVSRAKAWGALVGFLLGGYLSLPTNTVPDAMLRAIIGGAALYVAAWAGAVFVWRRLVIVEIKAREAELLSAAQAARARQLGQGQAPAGRPGQGASTN